MKKLSTTALQNPDQRGFALIACLSIMTLLVMLVVGMLSLSTSESKAATQEKYAMEARANARMALMVALGELQEAVGPDTRVTANSSILEEAGATGYQSNYLGVWLPMTMEKTVDGEVRRKLTNTFELEELAEEYRTSWDGGDKERGGRFLKWMVSETQLNQRDIDLPKRPDILDSNEYVTIVGEGSLGVQAPRTEHMRVGMVDLESGAYAWGVLSENMKVRVNESHALAEGRMEKLTERCAIPVSGIKSWNRANDPLRRDVGKEFLTSNNKVREDMDNAITQGTMALLGDGSPSLAGDLKPYFFDISTHSVGLLTNPKWGGWKQDLNTLAELPNDPSSKVKRPAQYSLRRTEPNAPLGGWIEAPNGNQFIFATKNYALSGWTSTGEFNNMGDVGPAWDDLLEYMNSYKKYSEGGSTEWLGSIPSFKKGADMNKVYASQSWRFNLPVFRKSMWQLSLFTNPDPSDNAKSNVYVAVKPICEVWNPNNVPLVMPPDFRLRVDQEAFPLSLSYEVSGGKSGVVHLSDVFRGGYLIDFNGMEIPAGESVYVSDIDAEVSNHEHYKEVKVGGLANLRGGLYRQGAPLIED
ncbi:hypothetical protein [Rubritalea tangerina]|uniref:Type 4 fimbrial biogenesis protein PilX N-terminal domain-containing protein n=1 Tax=Rubritalea tangerina TaxID=430798 RepID=A0ABW4ZE89_9BACT